MDLKPTRNSLGRSPLSDTLHRNPGVGVSYHGLGTMIMKNEQGSSHFPRRVRRVRKLAEPIRIRIGSWNVGSLTVKLRELVDETKWKGQKTKEVEDTGFKLWYTGATLGRNGVGILIDRSLKDGVVEVRRQGDRIILIRLVVGDSVLNVISAYAPQVGLSESTKMQFWEDLDIMVSTVSTSEKLFIGGDLNGHVGATNVGFERVHGGFGYGSRSQEGEDVRVHRDKRAKIARIKWWKLRGCKDHRGVRP
ncbi:hypothetical protein PVAP13_7KG336600 [Panicum virgatum]|uniref:Craniofacial development protein 2-like n=1 Tax=Panicum virgatum TaxID=38727 RepID=A0A8T0QL44_PANVG|nr:hypothetical protein PVAP13_7KG336600 [Panicum virgatum]